MQFRTKARAVDLLGKGQIADLPTAVTELWKNGYDAYADNLKANIYLDSYKDITTPLFVMTDDGKGMSKEDILDKWLVLGTDSKSRAILEKEPSIETLWKKPRIKAGEKGIGRLSVAFLGNPMLMLTKKIGHPLQAVFIDWRLLENYNLFLDDVDIPIDEIENHEDFQKKFESIKLKFLKNFNSTSPWKEQSLLHDKIISSVKKAKVPTSVVDSLLKDMLSVEHDHGTKFVIFEPIDRITELAFKEEDNEDSRDFIISSLSGFTNEFKEKKGIVSTSINIYKNDQEYDFLTSEGNFFNTEDYKSADIIIDGTFDGTGEFTGKITIYNETVDYRYVNPRKKDIRNNYGKVAIKLGYTMGLRMESKQSEISFNKINSKVTKYGGLYIYRDNFRVLPYGRQNQDFLRFEERRSKRAGSYFFSYRRMFGYIELSRNKNKKLKDKSSREGLINNAAYRAFESDLTNFFIDLAKEYFSDKANKNLFLDKKSEISNQKKEIEKDNKRAKEEKKKFTKSLREYPEKFEAYSKEYHSILNELSSKVQSANVIYLEIEDLLDRLGTLDIEFSKLIPKVPRRYKPTERQLDKLYEYENKLNNFIETTKVESEDLMLNIQEKLEIKDLKIEFSKNYEKLSGSLQRAISSNRDILQNKVDSILKEYKQRSKRILDDFNFKKDQIISELDNKEQIIVQNQILSKKFDLYNDQIEKQLIPLVNHISKLSFDIDEDLVQGAYRNEYEEIKYKWEQTRETAQLGVAVEIIDHEFNQLYAKINRSLEQLNDNSSIKKSNDFIFLQRNIKQLEDKYALLSPLYRIQGVYSKEISGAGIYNYLVKFFEGRIKDYDIDFNATKEFLNHTVFIKEPVIHTVFINIINNAIYWMRNVRNRTITLDYNNDTAEILICNSGTKIEEHRIEKIFDLFYSNRPNGRGIGLYLAKQSLNENGFDIYSTNDKAYNTLNGACFVIKSH